MKVSVIISTYNMPEWLEKVFWGFENQSHKDFEIVLADDGSGQETRELLKKFENKLEIIHVWHEDRGFQKSEILNKAIMSATTEYLIFTDGDCIPRKDFLEVHVNRAEKGFFLSGGYFKLPMSTSEQLSQEDIQSGRAFDKEWLYNNGLQRTYKTMKLTASGPSEKFLNTVTPTKATWNGHNASGWTEDLIKINGFNQDMQYGGQDRELGERLFNLGLKSKQIRYSAICIHLDHSRGYKTKESMDKNRAIRDAVKKNRTTATPNGIKRLNE